MLKKTNLYATLSILIILILFATLVTALTITLLNPEDSSLIGTPNINFTYEVDEAVDNCTIYHNMSTWQPINTSTNIIIGENNFTLTIEDEGIYKWNVLCSNDTTSAWATNNNTVTLDLNAPQVTQINPENNYETTTNNIEFEYFVYDVGEVASCSLLINGSENQTDNTITNDANNYFYATLPQGTYDWQISCNDSFNRVNTTNERTLEILSLLEWSVSQLNLGSTPSTGESVSETVELDAINLNEDITISCTGNCTQITHNFITMSANDESLLMEFSCSSNDADNYTATFNATSNQYEEGDLINVECEVYEAKADLSISNSTVYYEGDLIEGEDLSLNANVTNTGDVDAIDVNTSFYLEGELIGYEIKDVFADTTITFTTQHTLEMGDSEIDVVVDGENNIQEYSTQNNNATINLTVSSWQLLTGNVTGNFVLQDSNNNTVFSWEKELLDGSNLFVVDADSAINWQDLIALTRDEEGQLRVEDFEVADSLLGTTSNSDSINNTFGTDFETTTFNVFGKDVNNVPIIHTTDTIFKTGLLWDSSKDTNGYYDTEDREDLVFITNILSETETNLGIFDYEIEFVASLREYAEPNESNNVAIYVELK